jgi:hypothetical protein
MKLIVVATIFLAILVGGLFFLDKTVVVESPIIQNSSQVADIIQKQEDVKPSEPVEDRPYSLAEIQRYVQENAVSRAEPLKQADDVRGLYMTQSVANSPSSQLYKNIEKLADETEINAVVMDIKEINGTYLPQSIKKTIEKFHAKNIWVIARICAFRDNSLVSTNPSWYIKKETETTTPDGATTTVMEIWKDLGGGKWLDPASPAAQNYIINFSKQAIDFGFDELQFDYVRFPSDGNIKSAIYPDYNSSQKKYDVIRNFFLNLSGNLRQYKPTIVLSADLFGYVAQQNQAPEIGQRTQDVSDVFDYVSFMLYPSHFYNGFEAPADTQRSLPALDFEYTATTSADMVANHPYEIVLRSVLAASDLFKSLNSTTKIRPWLQDFNLGHDTKAGIYYNAERVRAQILGAKDGGSFGFLLWSASNVYTKGALEIN